MKGSDFFKSIVLPGALAGLIGGLVFGTAMVQLGMLPTVASLVYTDSGVAGFIIHMLLAAILGVGFSLLVWHQQGGAGEMLFWGLTYGTLWWFLGPLTLMPLLLGQGLMWDIRAAQAVCPSLPGHLWYGASMAIALTLLRRAWPTETSNSSNGPTSHEPGSQLTVGALGRGALAGLLGAWLLGTMLAAQDQLLAFSAMMNMESTRAAWLLLLMIGMLAGVGYALLYPRPGDSAGAGLIRGSVYGFFWWVAGALTLLPLLDNGHLAWSLEAARSSFALLPGFLLFGAATALFYHGFDALTRLLFADITLHDDQEGVGTQGLRVLGRGIVAGTIGGLLFTVVMVQLGFLPIVASLIGSTSPLAGFIVHLVISDLIGTSYGLLFQRKSYDIGSALGWGVSYGFFWWILGPLTLMPILLGAPPQWTVEAVAGTLGSLIGHLIYGAGLGITFYLLEARHNPWWIPVRQVQAIRIKRRKAQVFTSAPALWVMVVIIALTIPVVLGM
jgi:uncharacterized membrane protein YagU involved in acid resistance